MSDTIKQKAESMPDLDAIKHDIESLKNNIATLAQQFGDGAPGKAVEEGSRLYHRIAEEGGRVVKAASHEVEERPLASVLIAFALGFVGGRLLSR
jgi:ElaB/YqjD/DUF883 family membrane-anchored ribosome-binding protein